jgi:peroxiredoxin
MQTGSEQGSVVSVCGRRGRSVSSHLLYGAPTCPRAIADTWRRPGRQRIRKGQANAGRQPRCLGSGAGRACKLPWGRALGLPTHHYSRRARREHTDPEGNLQAGGDRIAQPATIRLVGDASNGTHRPVATGSPFAGAPPPRSNPEERGAHEQGYGSVIADLTPALPEQPPKASPATTAVVEQERGLAHRLTGRDLPDIELAVASHSLTIPLPQHLIGLTVLYFVPGEPDKRAWIDASQHRAYISRKNDFTALGARLMGVASQPSDELSHIGRYLHASHMLLSDPQLQLARALGLPTDGDRYRRIVLAASGTRITKMFPASDDHTASSSALEVLAWLQAQ